MSFLFPKPLREAMTWFGRGKLIKQQAKQEDSVIYGARSLQAQLGFFSRPTKDYDVYSKLPRRSARKLERKLDKRAGGNYYFVRPSYYHPQTQKVIHSGLDRREGTRDDIPIADYSPMPKRIRARRIQGNRYSRVKDEEQRKKQILQDKEYEFRHAKDQEDLDRIRLAREMGHI